MPDDYDALPNDPTEWEDSDNDGIGNNKDDDDDNDGMLDYWEEYYHLNPVIDDSYQDADGDGYTNLREFLGGSDPTDSNSFPQNSIPQMTSMPWIPLLLLDE